MPSPDKKQSFRVELLQWFVWKVITPVVLIGMFWPIFAASGNLQHPFSKAFTPGELLLFSAVLLIEAGGQGRHHEHLGLEFLRLIALIGGILLVAALVALKLFAISEFDEHRLTLYSCFACSVTLFSIVVSLLAFVLVTGREQQGALENIATGAST
jgi:hypothetical protein